MEQYTPNRFEWIVEGNKTGPSPSCDVELAGNDKLAIVPTLGSIIPGWLLAIPRVRALSLRELDAAERRHLFRYSATVGRNLASLAPNVFYFEHGPSRRNSIVGCGVDQAHLHIVPMQWDLVRYVLEAPEVEWTAVDSSDPWAGLPRGTEYYVISDLVRSYVGQPCCPQSQFFRKKIAELSGASDEWDYRTWPHYDRIKRTIEHFAVRPVFEAA
ncbi:MAG: hypothetical protein ACLP8B_11605 [Xanthobacteraceae bacterium]